MDKIVDYIVDLVEEHEDDDFFGGVFKTLTDWEEASREGSEAEGSVRLFKKVEVGSICTDLELDIDAGEAGLIPVFVGEASEMFEVVVSARVLYTRVEGDTYTFTLSENDIDTEARQTGFEDIAVSDEDLTAIMDGLQIDREGAYRAIEQVLIDDFPVGDWNDGMNYDDYALVPFSVTERI